MRPIHALPVVLIAAALAGCGGGGDDPSTDGGGSVAPPATQQQEPSTSTQSPRTTRQAPAKGPDGAQVFASAGCGGCHTLAAANASGNVGPNLDELMPDAQTVKAQVTNGGGGMPAFGGDLSSAEIDAVSSYVAQNAGR
jgi:mono/diheme cytochrome c family protein